MTDPTFEERRLSFGEAAAQYATYRPSYPREAVDWVFAATPDGVTDVADVAAGTGALTQVLVGLGLSVTAVEPDPGMFDELVRRVPEAIPRRAPAESLPMLDESNDAVLVAQAWHWFDQERASSEFARVLRPGGVVGLLWNLRDDQAGGWMTGLSDLVDGEDTLRGARDDLPVLGDAFTEVEKRLFAHERELTVDQLVGLVSTFSFIRLRPDADDVHAAVRDLVATHPQTRGKDRVMLPYVTATYRATRR